MRIAVDARELHGQPTGVGRYLASILDEWATLPEAEGHQFILCAPAPLDAPLTRSGRALTLVAAGAGTLWEQRELPRLVRHSDADVLLSPGYSAPIFSPAPFVVVVHDASFAAHPEWFTWREGVRRRLLARVSARRAARVLTISEFSKREIVRHLGVSAGKVQVIYPAAPRLDVPPPGTRHRRQTLLFVGSLFNRRHIPELIAGFARLARRMPDVRLEIVGDNRTLPPIDVNGLAAIEGVPGRVAFRSYVSDPELARLYAEARGFVFLSDYEGFGLTPLEALSADVPIVVLDTAVAREIYGGAAIYVPRPDPARIEEALERVLVDEAERARILEAARHTLSRYSWRACATQVLDALFACSRCRDSR